MENALALSGVQKTFKDFSLKDVSFELPKGYVMGLVGPNGAGKTTLIKLIMNLMAPEAGEIKILGRDSRSQEAEAKARIGFVYDVMPFYSDVSLWNTKRAIAPFYEKWNEGLFLELSGTFELPLKKKVKSLSQGMGTKFALVGALALYVPTIEWHQETDRMLSSLPVSRATVVFSRYVSTIFACAIGAGAWVSSGHLLSPLLASGPTNPEMWTTLSGITAFVSVAALLLSLFLPLYFRFGIGRGAMIFVPSVMGLYLLSAQPRGFVPPATAVQAQILSFSASIGPGWVLLLILLFLAAMMAASGRLSIRWFENRDL